MTKPSATIAKELAAAKFEKLCLVIRGPLLLLGALANHTTARASAKEKTRSAERCTKKWVESERG